MEEEFDIVLKKKIKAEKLQTSTKYPLNLERQENLTTYLFDYAMLSISKTHLRNG